ncbi:HNH endonuclease [Corynebacterium glyciniphilum]|uniref:HNH endonuclease n=1 Tax=Corynebacterium glyciniphilum TaxID=1404244 RepID=UPI003FD48A72
MECSKWTCHICGGPIDPHCEYPSPLYGSVDHIVPLSRGGAHIYENVKAAHLSCNSKKGAREDYVHEN